MKISLRALLTDDEHERVTASLSTSRYGFSVEYPVHSMLKFVDANLQEHGNTVLGCVSLPDGWVSVTYQFGEPIRVQLGEVRAGWDRPNPGCSTGKLIGLVGRAGSGKDTAAAALAPLGYHRVAFADALKRAAYDSNPLVRAEDNPLIGGPRADRIATLVDLFGWDNAKRDNPDVRRYLQRLGCAMRDVMPGCWVTIGMANASDHRARGEHVVITDVRFPDEVDAIRAAGGLLVRIDRPGTESVGEHVSEQVEQLKVDLFISNDGTVDNLGDRIRNVAQSLTRYKVGGHLTRDWHGHTLAAT